MTTTDKDTEIKSRLVSDLAWDDRVNASSVDLKVDNSIVTLEGEVGSYNEKQAAEQDAWTTPDVAQVINDLKVAYVSIPQIDDTDLQTRIENTFFWDADLISTKIDVEVSDGMVTISGTVDSLWKKDWAEYVARRIVGVIDVTNEITIVPTETILDEAIAKDIEQTMDRRFLKSELEKLDVKVESGVVTLSGEVTNYANWLKATNIAQYTTGVKSVIDEMQIEYANI